MKMRFSRNLVAEEGFEPTTSWLWAKRAAELLYPASFIKGTQFRDALFSCYHYTIGCSLPTGIRTQTFSSPNKNLKERIAVCISIVTPTGLEPVTPPWKGGDLDHLSTGPHAQLILSCSCQTRFFLIGFLLATPHCSRDVAELLWYFVPCLQTYHSINHTISSVSTPHACLPRQGGNRTPITFNDNSPSPCVAGQTVTYFREAQPVCITNPAILGKWLRRESNPRLRLERAAS